jgi:hypothetical protein
MMFNNPVSATPTCPEPPAPERDCRGLTLARARLVLFAAATVLCGLGCSSVGSYGSTAPPGADFAGTWRLNVAASDDPRKALAKFRPRRGASQQTQQMAGRRRRGQQSGQNSNDVFPDDDQGPSAPTLLTLIPNSDVLRNEVLAIKQRPDAFIVDLGTSTHSFTPGEKSVVSVPEGVGDQSAGWHGKDFVVDVRSQLGMQMTETFSLSTKSGRQLIIKIHLNGSGVPRVALTRVYDATSAEAPRSLPTIE